MYVCMYVCMHTHIHMYIYIYTYVCVRDIYTHTARWDRSMPTKSTAQDSEVGQGTQWTQGAWVLSIDSVVGQGTESHGRPWLGFSPGHVPLKHFSSTLAFFAVYLPVVYTSRLLSFSSISLLLSSASASEFRHHPRDLRDPRSLAAHHPGQRKEANSETHGHVERSD